MDVSRLGGPTTFRRSLSGRSSLLRLRSIVGAPATKNLSHKKAQKAQKGEGMTRVVFGCAVLVLSGVAAFGQAPAPAVLPAECVEMKTRLDRAETKLSDWPALARYREDNNKTAPPAKNEQRVVFMGDSITDGWDSPNNGGFFPGKPYVNRGISGQTTPQMLIRFRRDVIELKPKVVVILAGTNDIAGNTGPMTLQQIEENIASMVDIAHANGIRVVLSSVMPVYPSEKRPQFFTQRPPEKIVELNRWIRSECERTRSVYLNYFAAMVGPDGL